MIRHALALSVLLVSAALAQEPALLDRAAVLREAAKVTPEKYPDADTVLVDDLVRVRYNADGTDETWDETYTKALTERGRQESQTIQLHFDLVYDTVTVVRVEICKPDGKIVPVDIASQSQVMTERGQMSANIFDPNNKVLSVNVPGLEVGDTLHYVTHRRTIKTRMANTWVDFQVFEYTAPIRRYVYEVTTADAMPLKHALVKAPVSGTITATTNRTPEGLVYRWEVRDVPRVFEEPNMPSLYSVAQRLLVSTVQDWQTISKWYWNLSEPRLTTTPEIAAKVAELTSGVSDERERLRRLFKFVSQQIRYMGITTEKEAPGYEPHDVAITFNNRYGVCRDKAALLVAMLRLAGFKGYPVLIHAGEKKDVEVPMPYFNHAIVAVQEADGSYTLMDPTDENTADLLPGYLCDKSFLVAKPEGETLLTSPIIPASNNLLRVATTGKLDAHGVLTMSTEMHFDGINDTFYRGHMARMRPDEQRRFVEGRVASLLPGARLTALKILPEDMRDTSQPLSMSFTAEVPDFLVEGERHRMLSLPWLAHGFGAVNFVLGQTGLDQRRFPLETEFACGATEQVRLELPGAVDPLAVPATQPIDRSDLHFDLAVRASGNVLEGSGSFVLKDVRFAPDRYLALKEFLRDIEYARRQRVILAQQVDTAREVDAEFLHRKVNVDIADAHTSTVTEDVAVKVLTYGGKKRLSELHVDFNPIWETVSLTNVTVVGATGTVHRLATQEVNVMDAEWVGSAPRYPAARTLVASLPGVEVGSEIRYTIVRARRDRPFVSVSSVFQGFDPIKESTLTVSAPAGLPLRIAQRGDGLAFTAVTNAGRVVRTWKSGPRPGLVREEGVAPTWSWCPTVGVSAGDWTAYARDLLGPLPAAAKGKDVRDFVRKATKGARTPLAKATAIRDAVDVSIRLAGPQADDLPASIVTPPDQVLREGYANSRDRAVLLHALLREAGFKPSFVLVSGGTPQLPELRNLWLSVPQASTFESVLVRVDLDGAPVYFNDTDQYSKLGSTPHDGCAALTESGTLTTVQALPDHGDAERYHFGMTIASNGDARITVKADYYGMEYAGFHRQMAEQTPEERRRFAQETMAMLSQAAKLDGEFQVDTTNYPATLTFSATVPRFAVRNGRFLQFALPQVPGVRLPGQVAERHNPLYLGERSEVNVTYDVELPGGHVALAPAPVDSLAPNGVARLRLTPDGSTAPGRLRIEQAYDFKPAVVPVHAYESLRDWSARARHPANRSVLVDLED